MPSRCMAGSQETNPYGSEGTVFARAYRDWIQAYRRRKLCLSERRTTDGRQRKGAGATQSARRCRNHRIVVNEKGAERAIATGTVTTLGYPHSISETFLRKNQ